MALLVGFANVIARLEPIEARLGSDGLDAYAARHPNYAQDDCLCRVGFMSSLEAHDVRAELASVGMGDGDVAIVEDASDLPCWLEFGAFPDGGCVWLRGTEPGAPVPLGFGFLLQGPLDLMERLPLVLTTQNLTVGPVEPGPAQSAGVFGHVVHDRRAAVSLDVVTSNRGFAGFWARRDVRRSVRWFSADLALSHRLESILRQEGAVSA